MFLSQICSSLFRQPFARILGQTPILPDGRSILKCTLSPLSSSLVQNYSSSSKPARKFTTPSPYKTPKPKKYGYTTNHFTGGLLPRVPTDNRIKGRPEYKVRDVWSRERALFGQNDYIDILGDGNIHPKDLIRGPPWLIGFRGNEMERLTRRLRFEGHRLRYLYPTKYHKIKKRIRWLFRFYNYRRHKSSY